ncbi:hypothetical protein BDW22DRAFT_914729 [Trametopsis cervina]|nr:hypothetical protein BDW22DRAFT_914729 [Trametopsis cervina]
MLGPLVIGGEQHLLAWAAAVPPVANRLWPATTTTDNTRSVFLAKQCIYFCKNCDSFQRTPSLPITSHDTPPCSTTRTSAAPRQSKVGGSPSVRTISVGLSHFLQHVHHVLLDEGNEPPRPYLFRRLAFIRSYMAPFPQKRARRSPLRYLPAHASC